MSGASAFLENIRFTDFSLRFTQLSLCQLADSTAAIREVFHLHLHVIPRFEGDDFGLKFGPDNFKKTERAELDAAAEKIRNALGLLSISINR